MATQTASLVKRVHNRSRERHRPYPNAGVRLRGAALGAGCMGSSHGYGPPANKQTGIDLLMREAQRKYNWKLNFAEIAGIWRGGCIIRARFLQKITEAYMDNSALVNLLLAPYFNAQIKRGQANWRRIVQLAAQNGVAAPAFMSALAYYDGYRSARLPTNLLQAQRDYFGAHTYERTDEPRGRFFHLDWPEPGRPQVAIRPAAKEKVEAHMRELIEQGFEVAVVKDATAAPNHPQLGDGYPTALTNFAFIANAVLTASEAVKAMENGRTRASR